MPLITLSSPDAVADFCQSNPTTIVTFSAHWCGPCRASKPALEALAATTTGVAMGIAYEDDLGDALSSVYQIRAFPTHVWFVEGRERERIEGANMTAVQALVQKAAQKSTSSGMPTTGGATLGSSGSSSGAVLSPEQAREARLQRLGGGLPAVANAGVASPPAASPVPVTAATPSDAMPMDEDDDTTQEADDATKPSATVTTTTTDGDTDMADAIKDDTTTTTTTTTADPCASLDPAMVATLVNDMGFSKLRAQKGLLYGTGRTTETAVEWLLAHQDDADLDDPLVACPTASTTDTTTTTATAQSYKCNECGKILSNMANLELHANQTGHADFEESTAAVKPLTAEEKQAKIAEIKTLLKAKRAQREEAEKVDLTEREKQRRFMGKEMKKTQEQLDVEQRKREAYLRKKEKQEFAKERQRLREELARDKAERAASKGKLSSRLGVDGYKPDGIQYDVSGTAGEAGGGNGAAADGGGASKKAKINVAKIDEYIGKVASYKAGGDGGKCLKILKIYISNLVDSPDEEKFRTVKTDNKTFKTKVKPFVGAKSLLLACGFSPTETGEALVLSDDADRAVLAETKAKLEAALVAYG